MIIVFGVLDIFGMLVVNMWIDSDCLWDSLEQMVQIGFGIVGGNNWQVLIDVDIEGWCLFQGWCEDVGMMMCVDQMGNMFFCYEGIELDLDLVYIGSYLDIQLIGGCYDGVLGVLVGLEVICVICDMGLCICRLIVVINWINEEGMWFVFVMLVLGVFVGVIDQDFVYVCKDVKGVSFGDELVWIGWCGDEVLGDCCIYVMFEYYIEQGLIFEVEGQQIGVVIYGQGLCWIECMVMGKGQYIGLILMWMCWNVGCGLVQLIELVYEIVMRYQFNVVGVIGYIDIFFNSCNIIVEKVVFIVDFCSYLLLVLLVMIEEFMVCVFVICVDLGCEFDSQIVGQFDLFVFDFVLVKIVCVVVEWLGYWYMDIVLGVGYDVCWINKVVLMVMIMCFCVDGLLYNEVEEISLEWVVVGVDVLLNVVFEIVGVQV